MPFDDTSPRGWDPGPDPAPTWGERVAAVGLLTLSTALCALGTRPITDAFMAAFAGGDIYADVPRVIVGALAVMLWALTAPRLLAVAAGRWP